MAEVDSLRLELQVKDARMRDMQEYVDNLVCFHLFLHVSPSVSDCTSHRQMSRSISCSSSPEAEEANILIRNLLYHSFLVHISSVHQWFWCDLHLLILPVVTNIIYVYFICYYDQSQQSQVLVILRCDIGFCKFMLMK